MDNNEKPGTFLPLAGKSWRPRPWVLAIHAVGILTMASFMVGSGFAQGPPPAPLVGDDFDATPDPDELREALLAAGFDSLATLPVPVPTDIEEYIKDNEAAIVLGKALFWDELVGSDGMSCASCHFHAGADSRHKNQISPSILGGDGIFNALPTGGGGPNYALKREDFPFHVKVNPTGQEVESDRDEIASSGGVIFAEFQGFKGLDSGPPTLPVAIGSDLYINRILTGKGGRLAHLEEVYQHSYNLARNSSVNCVSGVPTEDSIATFDAAVSGQRPRFFSGVELCEVTEQDPLGFTMDTKRGFVNLRRVEPRNTPTVINAVYSFRNFWDGRADFFFNGRNPHGPKDESALVYCYEDGGLIEVAICVDNSSLASQAVGPVESNLEMACVGRSFLHVARKMLKVRPLKNQCVSYDDSVLGKFVVRGRNPDFGFGLRVDYGTLIKKAFQPKWWKAPHQAKVNIDGEYYSLMEANFSMFFGFAVQAYESTLISPNSPFDRFMGQGGGVGGDNNALTEAQLRGANSFASLSTGCRFCHSGPTFSDATYVDFLGGPFDPNDVSGVSLLSKAGGVLTDTGFHSVGGRESFEDLSLQNDEQGYPLSFARMFSEQNFPEKYRGMIEASPNNMGFLPPGVEPPVVGEQTFVEALFKTPTLRNVSLTGPYFHYGGYLTLEQVIQFYSRGGNFDGNPSKSGLVVPLDPINGNRDRIRDMAAFLRALTDEDVAYERAPFDHPSLKLPHGHIGDENRVLEDKPGSKIARTEFLHIDCVGKDGREKPIEPFLGGSLLDENGVPQDDGLPADLAPPVVEEPVDDVPN